MIKTIVPSLLLCLLSITSCNNGPKASGTLILMLKGNSNTFVCEKGMSLSPENGLYIYGVQATTGEYLELNLPDIKKEGSYSLAQLAAINPDNKITLASTYGQADIPPFGTEYNNKGTVKIELDGANATVTIDCMLNDKINDTINIVNGQYIGTFSK